MDRNTTADAGETTAVRQAASDTDAGVAALLGALVGARDSIVAAVLATVDGLPIASVADAALSTSRLSAMGSALLGLCEATTGESRIGTCSDVIIDATEGRLLAMSVAYRGAPAVLMTVGSADAPLGHVLWATRKCAQAVAHLP